MFNKASQYGRRNIFLCDWILDGEQPWLIFQSAEVYSFYFLSYEHVFGCHIKHYKVSHCLLCVFTHWMGLFVHIIPLFVLKTKADKLFID